MTRTISAKGMLTVHFDQKDFFRIPVDAAGGNSELLKVILHINNTWMDIEFLNIQAELLNHRICNEEDYSIKNKHPFQIELGTLVGMMSSIGNSMYVNYFIIHQLLRKLKDKIWEDNENFRNVFSEYENTIGNRISAIRNNLIVKRETEGFYDKQLDTWSTDNFGMDRIVHVTYHVKRKGVMIPYRKAINCNARIDGRTLQEFLMRMFASDNSKSNINSPN